MKALGIAVMLAWSMCFAQQAPQAPYQLKVNSVTYTSDTLNLSDDALGSLAQFLNLFHGTYSPSNECNAAFQQLTFSKALIECNEKNESFISIGISKGSEASSENTIIGTVTKHMTKTEYKDGIPTTSKVLFSTKGSYDQSASTLKQSIDMMGHLIEETYKLTDQGLYVVYDSNQLGSIDCRYERFVQP
ncbi:hypothetical protein MRY82_10465 [bacterium]|nr:hypothetical protein [bacterium]